MTVSTDQIQYTAYGPDRFPSHLPFAQRGYFFTVPGDFPEDTPSHTNVTDWEMVVYRKHGEWEARDVNGERRVWGVGPSRRVAAGLAFQAIARKRRYRAADIANARALNGLEEVPPYQVEVTSGVTLVLAPQAVAILVRIEPAEEGPASYRVNDVDGGGQYLIRADANVTLHSLQTGVLHIRCGCDPDADGRFENEPDALEYVREQLSAWEVCPKSPGAPAAEDQQPEDDEDQAVAEPATL
ncbi:hypothetical protein ACWD5R_44080 [Streptomyces sp. NPDC002514]|uniref:hypothetical protein n=1 Tax=Streptomyces sp. NPDC001270 TaxID=3364554 RepID=UPI0036C0FA87